MKKKIFISLSLTVAFLITTISASHAVNILNYLTSSDARKAIDLISSISKGETISSADRDRILEMAKGTPIVNETITSNSNTSYDSTREAALEARRRDLETQIREQGNGQISSETWTEYNNVTGELNEIKKSNPTYIDETIISNQEPTQTSEGEKTATSGNNSGSLGRITSSVEKVISKYDFRNYSGTRIGMTRGNTTLSNERSIFCGDFEGVLPNLGELTNPRTGAVLESVENGYSIDCGNTKPTLTTTKGRGVAKYNSTGTQTAGIDKEWAKAYVLNQFAENIGISGSGQSANDFPEAQRAYWALVDGQPFESPIYDEAMAYQDYKERLKEDGGFKVSDEFDKEKVAFNQTTSEIIVGPISVHYQRGYANVEGREKVEFGGIKSITLYDQSGSEIPQSAWKIKYTSEDKDTAESKENDEGYGIEGLDGFYEYPYSDEKFHIVLKFSACPDVREISKIVIKFFDIDYSAEYEELEGEYVDVTWKVESKHCKGGKIERYTVNQGGQPKVITKPIPCAHGKMTAHDFDYKIVAHAVDKEGQPLTGVLNTTIKENEYEYTITPPKEPEKRTPNWPIPSIISPNWPYWPDWPDYPDWPDWPDDFDLTLRFSGIVWEDTQTGKESECDGFIGYKNDGTQEQGMKNIKVTLYKYGTKDLAEAKQNPVYTDESGAYYFTRVPMGKYDIEFEYDGMTYTTTKAYSKEDGTGSAQDYINNPDDTGYVKASKTEEVESERQAFNDKFYEITGDSSKATVAGKSYGIARDASGNKTANLEYTTQNGKSKLITLEQDGKVKPEFAMTSRTSSLGVGYPFYERYVNYSEDTQIDNNTYEANYKYMCYINLGLKRRPEADFAVVKDVSSATLTINKKQIDYKYNSRAGIDAFDIEVKNSPVYSNIYYNTAIYESDYNFRIDDYKPNTLGNNGVSGATIRGLKPEDEELKVFVTYRMTIRNQSEIATGTINELVDYYDKSYTLINNDVTLDIQNGNGVLEKGKVVARQSYYETTLGRSGTITWKTTGKYDTNLVAGMQSAYTTDLSDIILQSGEDLNVYVTFEVNKDMNRFVKTGEKYNYIEINSFSTFDRGAIVKTKTTGQVDRDSAPGNMNPLVESSKEDDSDSAPTINIKLGEDGPRKMNGIVWEDNRTKTLSTGQIVGDGLMDENEKRVNGVTVQLIELVDAADGRQYEYIWQQMSTGENGYKYVNSTGNVMDGKRGDVLGGTTSTTKGEYKFENYIPGNYIVRFIYGDTEKTILPARNDGTSYNGHDYKSTAYQLGENLYEEWYNLSNETLNTTRMSDAKDNEARRLDVIKYSKVMKNDIAQVLYSADPREQYMNTNLHDELKTNTWMYADTAKLKVQVEYDKTQANGLENYSYNIRNIDFGLEKRPENKIDLDKEIIGIKVTLSNGNTIIDTEQGARKNVNWTKNAFVNGSFMPGKIHIYMDDEQMQGATIQVKYRITVKNIGEVDTTGATANSVGLTYYTGKANSSDRIVTTTIDKVIDYVDNSLVFPADNTEWQLIENAGLGTIEQMKQNGYLDKTLNIARNETVNNKVVSNPMTQVIVTDRLGQSQLRPGDGASIELTLSKVISANDSQDDLSYDNIAEVIQFTNTVGRKANIPGSLDPNKNPTEDDEDKTETIKITPPTGANKSTTYLLIGASVLVVVAGAIVIIRKKSSK